MYEKLHDKSNARSDPVRKDSIASGCSSIEIPQQLQKIQQQQQQPLIQDVNHTDPNVYPRSTSMPNMGSQAGAGASATKLNVPWRINSSDITPVPENDEELDILASQAPSQATSDIELQLQGR